MKGTARFRRHVARGAKSLVFKAKKAFTNLRFRILYRAVAILGQQMCLITLLRFAIGQSTEKFFYITNALILVNHPIRLILNFLKPRLSQSLWPTLWLDKNFHAFLMVGGVILSRSPPLLFYGIYLLKFFIRTLKVILEKVTPRMEELSMPIREWLLKMIKSEDLGTVLALMEIGLVPFLILRSIELFSVPMAMAACVTAFLYLPHMYLVDGNHRMLWKWANIAYTQKAFDNQATYGAQMLRVHEVFADYSELLFVGYPFKYLRSALYDAD